jgi:hypothetical protein
MNAIQPRLPEPSTSPRRPRRYPAAYHARAVVRPAVDRPVGPPIRLVVGPLPVRVLRAITRGVRHLFGGPDLAPPARVVQDAPRCLHCKGRMAEKYRELPEPYGVWAVFTCSAAGCPVCQGPCRSRSRMFLPAHWQSGPPGQITYL